MGSVELYPHQQEALSKLRTGSILCGGVGTGKSRTAIAYFYQQCGGSFQGTITHMSRPKNLYIITTARKRDTLEWDRECSFFMISKDPEISIDGCKLVIDSWNNVGKYVDVKDSFFIFDEQRVVGSGAWVKSFLKIAKSNEWILLSATPGDTWMDYVPVFLANGFYKNKTEFIRRHVVYNRYSKYPKVDRYVETGRLERLRNSILVNMPYDRLTVQHHEDIFVEFDQELMELAWEKRWNPFMSEPIRDVSELCYISRKICNVDLSRLDEVRRIVLEKKKVIIFYNFDYELYILRTLSKIDGIEVAEWNGHKHEEIPDSDSWVYLVQYLAGAEGWNCVETDTIVFYSQNYSYKIMVQSAGRIDRLNTPFRDLYYYHLKSKSTIDKAIGRALKSKKNFNEKAFFN